MTQLRWIIPFCAALLGSALGIWLTAPRENAVGTQAAQSPERRVAGSAVESLSLEDVRRVVREELAARRGHELHQAVPAARPSAEQIAAAAQAEAVLVTALGRRQWTDADAGALREQFHMMSVDQQVEILRRFSVAVNRGELVPQAEQIPF